MAKGQMRSNKEKKKPKQDKNKKKGGPAPSPFAAGQNQDQPGHNPYGKKGSAGGRGAAKPHRAGGPCPISGKSGPRGGRADMSAPSRATAPATSLAAPRDRPPARGYRPR